MNWRYSRREFCALVGAGLAATAIRAQTGTHGRLFAYVGSWTQGPFGLGGGGGISVFSVGDEGELTLQSRTGPELADLNAGYVCTSPDGRFLYSTEEVKDLHEEAGAGGGVLSFSIDSEDGSLTHMNTQPSMGVNPAYINIDAEGSRVFVTNHGNYDPVVRVTKRNGIPEIEKIFDDGTVTMLPVAADGTLEAPSDVIVLERTGSVDALAQRSPHAHSINFDPTNRWGLVCDKGADRLYVIRVELDSLTFGEVRHFSTNPGISPRHSVFHPTEPYVFVINERGSSISSYRFDSDDGELTHIETLPTIPSTFTQRNTTADIRVHPNGRFVYGSNRGHDSIAIYRLDEDTGRLTSEGTASAEGATPRNFNFHPSGDFLLVANQGSNEIVTFAVDPETGGITPTGARTPVLKPAVIKFLNL